MRGPSVSALPIYVVLIDLWYGLLLNITNSLNEPNTHTPNILPTVPDVAFNWLQVFANAGMVVVISFALWQLIQLNKAVVKKQVFSMGAFRLLGLILALAFSLPALYGLVMAILQLLQGHWVASFGNLRYLVSALCIAYCGLLCLWRLLGWWRTRKSLMINPPQTDTPNKLSRTDDTSAA